MAEDISDRLIIATSSRALFCMDESNRVYEEEGVKAYAEHQIAHEEDLLQPGVAFPLVQKLLRLNQSGPYVEVILLSRNSADTGLRVFNSIQHYGLDMTRAVFTSGESPYKYVSAFGSHLFLSANPEDVINALNAGCAAATILHGQASTEQNDQLRIAFDGDAVVFSDEAERVYQEKGLEAFAEHERAAARDPLSAGPFRGFLVALHRLQHQFPANDKCPLRTALVTARSAPSHERVIRTLRAWGVRIDEALFLGGLSKGDFLKAFQADVFFDDQRDHCESANNEHIAAGHVPHGVMNDS